MAKKPKKPRKRFGIEIKSDTELATVVREFDLTRQRIREIEAKARKGGGQGDGGKK